MKKIYCTKCGKYSKLKNPKILYIFNETLVIFVIYDKHGSNNNTIFKEDDSY